jgi:hypothetical protein
VTAKLTTKTSSNKLPIVITICVTVLLIGAISAWVYIHKQQLAQQDKQFQTQQATAKANDAFKKNQDCQKYASGIKSTIDENNASKVALYIENFETLFYSPKDDACLYAYQGITSSGSDIGKREYFIYNALTNNKVTSFQFPQQYADYKKFVLDYSGGEVRL